MRGCDQKLYRRTVPIAEVRGGYAAHAMCLTCDQIPELRYPDLLHTTRRCLCLSMQLSLHAPYHLLRRIHEQGTAEPQVKVLGCPTDTQCSKIDCMAIPQQRCHPVQQVAAPSYALPISCQLDLLAHGSICSCWCNCSQIRHGSKAAAQLEDLGKDLLACGRSLSSFPVFWQHVLHVLDGLFHADAEGKHACYHFHSRLPFCH